MGKTVTQEDIRAFEAYLRREERSDGTVEKYLRDVRDFKAWLGKREVTKETVTEWKTAIAEKLAPVTVNSKISAVNGLLKLLGCCECCVKFLRIQHKAFRDRSRNLTKEEFERLVATAEARGKRRLALLMQTICATGIRVSEVEYITVEAARSGCAEISLKGKIRTILLPGKLARKLLKYAKAQKIASGRIFLTKSGKSLSRRQIWSEMKSVCKAAGVSASKVFPHNLRHLFAVTFYKACRDIVKLADVLGHSSIDTTRIYLVSPGDEHIRTLDRLGLVS